MSPQTEKPDAELKDWMADWQADPAPASEVRDAIRRRVRRQSLGMAWIVAGELALAAALLAFVIHFAIRHPTPIDVATMSGLALLILWITAYGLWNRRGTWRPAAETTTAFLALSETRCRRRLRALTAGWWLLAAEVALYIPWIASHLRSAEGRLASKGAVASYGFLVLTTAAVAGVLLWVDRRTRRELKEIEEMRREVGGGE